MTGRHYLQTLVGVGGEVKEIVIKGRIFSQVCEGIYLHFFISGLIIFFVVEDGVEDTVFPDRERHGLLAKIASDVVEPA